MYQLLNIAIIIVFCILYVRSKKTKDYRFNIKGYLATLGEGEKKVATAYISGALLIGLVIPALIWAAETGANLAIEEMQAPKTSLAKAYEYIGICYSNKSCQDAVLNKPGLLYSDDERQALVEQIRPYELAAINTWLDKAKQDKGTKDASQ